MGAKGALAVAECLKANDQVRSLNLAENSLGDEGCAAMADVLGANTTLTSLSLASNGIGLLGAQALAGSLRTSGSLVELSLRSNRLDDRAAVQLAASIASSTSLSRLDLSYNRLGEEAGKALGEMLATNRSLLELALAWNGLGNRGCALLADGLRRNSVLSRIDLAYNGLGDDGARAVSDALAHNSSLTHLDLSHNEINADGAHALAGGIEASSLVSVELGFNPMGMTQQRAQQQDVAGVEALVRALRARGSLVSVGLTEVSEGASPKRGRASRYDPEDPAGHYVLDLSQAWDRFLAEKLWARTLEREGEMWANLTLDSVKVGPPGADGGAGGWELPSRGVLEFDHADYRLGLEASLRFELGSAADRRLASSLLGRAAGTEGEACVHARLDGAPCALQAADALPERGVLRMVYVVTRPLKRLGVELELDLGEPAQRALCLELWRRELTTGHEAWARVSLTPPEGGEAAPLDHYAGWRFPAMPEGGVLRLEYTVQLSCKRQDRGACFSAPMEAAKCARLAELLGTEGLSAEERWSLVRMAADANYFTAQQVRRRSPRPLLRPSARSPRVLRVCCLPPTHRTGQGPCRRDGRAPGQDRRGPAPLFARRQPRRVRRCSARQPRHGRGQASPAQGGAAGWAAGASPASNACPERRRRATGRAVGCGAVGSAGGGGRTRGRAVGSASGGGRALSSASCSG